MSNNIVTYSSFTIHILLLIVFKAPPLLAAPSSTTPLSSAADYALNELQSAGWRQKTAEAVVAVNEAWFTILKRGHKKHKKNFLSQIKLLKQLSHSVIVSRFLRKHPETAGLLALSDNPTLLVKILNKPACYNALTRFYALHTTASDIQLLTEALEKHRELLCKLAMRGILSGEAVFLFSRNSRGAREYDLWLEDVFNKYLWRSDEQLAEIMGFIIEQGQSIRQRLDKDQKFYKNFRKKLWPALMRVVDNNGAFELLANDPHIWELLSLQEGEILLTKWGLGPIGLLVGEDSYPADMQPTIIQILLQGDDHTVDALFKYKNEPLFRNLMRRSLAATTQAALAKKLASICPNYPACPQLPNKLRYFASITDNAGLAEEVGASQNGPVTWIPFHGSYYAIRKMTQGRDITTDDILNMGIDALIFVPSVLFAGAFSGALHPLGHEIMFHIGIIGVDTLTFTPYSYHLVKPIGKFAIRTGNRTGKLLTQQSVTTQQTKTMKQFAIQQGKKMFMPSATRPIAAFMKQSQQIFNQLEQQGRKRISYDVTKPILFLYEKTGRKGRNAIELVKFDAKVFMRYDTKVVMNLNYGLNHKKHQQSNFFRKTTQRALSAQVIPSKQTVSAWQQNISAWWLINATMTP